MSAANQHGDQNMTEKNHDYWRSVLAAGGLTTIPRWTVEPIAGTARRETILPDDLASKVSELASETAVTVDSVLLAAHAKVLAALSGDRDIATGFVAERGDLPLPCRLTTETDTWRDLIAEAHRAESELLAHRDYPVRDLQRLLGHDEPAFETVLAPCEEDPSELDADTVLSVAFCLNAGRSSGRGLLRLTYRTDAIDPDFAARIAGYYLTAVQLMVADPDATHSSQTLVSADELRFQREDLAGPIKELPDRRFHELFEERVVAHPDAVAGEYGDRELTYAELNDRANRLARALIARGVSAETVVAVVTERNLDWMASVLAIFKAGAVYLPIEPHFPSDRIATTLRRAECKVVVTEPGSTGTLEGALDALDGVDCFFVETAFEDQHDGTDLGIEVGPDQLAYIYFTSGSTGEPKGAMCEHGGMLNHLYAKIDDFEIGEGEIVAQIAPQCFDISLWQLVTALLVGGRTVLIEQDTLLDPERFVDKIVGRRVAVMQVVPSYLEVLLTYLEQQPRELPDLHCVSVTGEALTLELAQRWFDNLSGIKLGNAYGLTETSDDTNHEVMHRAPDGSVPLGPAVMNVEVRVVDENLAPVPLGSPGEIVFSGICVGRGYINDPERTRLAFMDDPLEPGERLYRSGDYGRWRPDGKLEFRGRRDAQVKIRGFRIEIGEIENAILGVPGVRQGAVVVTERADQSKQLVGFYSGEKLDVASLQAQIGESLPEYMVPSIIHWQESLPLTDNGKVDKKNLRVLASELDVVDEVDHEAPQTPTEQKLAAAWATVLGVPEDQIGRLDDFFDRGGTSLTAVKVAIALDRVVTLKDVTNHPVLADLAALVDGASARPTGLLQAFSEPEGATAALVCFPYAGGNAVNYQPMARALRDSGLAVYAIELPGHDLAAEREAFAPLADVVEQVVAEISDRGLTTVMLWGHSSGTPLAVEAAKALQTAGVDVPRVFLGAQLPGDAAKRRAAAEALADRSNADIAAELSADSGYTKLGDLDEERADHVGAAYRHDCMSAHNWFIEMLENPPTVKLSTPVTVVVAVDDPATADYASGHLEWKLAANEVDLHQLIDGDHYFLRTNPDSAAQLVAHVASSLPSSH